MQLSDPIADLLARLKNGLSRHKDVVVSLDSRMHRAVLDVLQEEGFIRGYKPREVRKGISELDVELKYHEGRPAIKVMKKVSKPGLRIYKGMDDLAPVYNGLGISVLSTSKGVLSDRKAREMNVGGEVLCTVF